MSLINISHKFATAAHIVFRRKNLIVVYYTKDHRVLEGTIEAFSNMEYAEAYAEKLEVKFKKKTRLLGERDRL